MTEQQDNNTKTKEDSRTISIEIPGNIFAAMYRIMSGRGSSAAAASSCCDMPRDMCCPESDDANEQGFTFVLKRKE